MISLPDAVTSVFSEQGTLSSLAGYEFRPQQLSMAQAILGALQEKRHLIIEAPTGVGKSLAYLVPALLFARRENRKAIVSTHTKHLQEQLLQKDVPIVRSLLNLPFDAVALKGRGNYLCTTRLGNMLRQQRRLFDAKEFDELQRIREWSLVTGDGDVENLPFLPSARVWQQVCSEKGTCSPTLCTPDCFFQLARRRARQADLVIMNHALFFTLFVMQDSDEFFLFENDFVVFDEAHTLEQIAGLGVGRNLSRSQVLFAIHRLFNAKTRKGLLAGARLKRYQSLCAEAEKDADRFFSDIEQVVRGTSGGSGMLRVGRKYIVDDTATQRIRDLQTGVKEIMESGKTRITAEELVVANRLLSEVEMLIGEFLEQPDEGATYWVELGRGKSANVLLRTAPTSVAASIGTRLFREGSTVIMTSGTLSVGGSLEYFQGRIGATDAEALILDSPFNFSRQMLLALARDVPPPDQEGYEPALPGAVYKAVLRSQGKALVLFTNASLMRTVANVLRERLESDEITLLVQDAPTGRHRLLERFKSDVRSVLFGLDSFWMGVDVPGEALEHVIITRLPFAVPDHPLIQARMELIAKGGGNSFLEFTLPEAVLKFKQGVGRLIRSKSDKGVITILDSRILTKPYGRTFLQSLPRCSVEIVSADGTVLEEHFGE